MRAITKDLNAVPPALLSADCMQHLNEIIANPGTVKINSKFYKGTVKLPDGTEVNTVWVALKELYLNKCAYCEALCHHPDVEHFRPKGTLFAHPRNTFGYYWLAFEWTNLVPACHECNKVFRKGNKFPIQGTRVTNYPSTGVPATLDHPRNRFDSPYLMHEGPLYVHPEYCADPFTHFDFLRTGAIVGLTSEGRRTIEDLQLDRDDLNGWRRQIYETYLDSFRDLLFRYRRQGSTKNSDWFMEEIYHLVFKIIFDGLDEKKDYTLFRKSLYRKIDYFFIDAFDPIFHNDLRTAIEAAIHQII
ncbi:MAG: hypothetical protein J7623_31425 [Chitinophaga sp.]|uniref:hypothetical protein n=1 Tax=Chitinophaga sp. TaxID=1869181 RepID=UPI001B27A160|nr:hypothetical protein [Chitinophaga sp.]MBO9733195.1 hypothetical protein [Chitinophaga sp.]